MRFPPDPSTSKSRAIRRAAPGGTGETVQETVRKYNPPVDPLHLEEYRSLRAVIRERGSLRVALFVGTVAAWALAAAAVAALLVQPLAALVPLLILVAGFEAVHALHVGAERIGRYLYVRYEIDGGPAWERTIGAFGSGQLPVLGRPSGAHFALVFALAVAANFMLLVLSALPVELAALAVIHGLAIVRFAAAASAAAGLRAQDEARFKELLK